MLSYTQALSLYVKNTNNNETSNTSYFDQTYNEKLRTLLSKRDWPFLERSDSQTTVTDKQLYNLPANVKKLLNIYVTISSQKYIPREVPSRDFWDRLTASTAVTSNIPQWYTVIDRQVGIYPASSDGNATLTTRFSLKQKNLTIADYTTGTITSIANGATTVTGSGTTWTTKMNGRWIRITDSNDDDTGDGEWYEISSVTTTTELELVSPYEGITIAAATAAYTIGQMSLLRETYDLIPVYQTIADYWLKEKDGNAHDAWEQKAKNLELEMIEEFSGLTQNPVIQEGYNTPINPNLTLQQ